MAALIKHVLSKNPPGIFQISRPILVNVRTRNYAKKHFKQRLTKVEMPPCRKLKPAVDSLSTKGFLRCQRSYTPPSDVESKLKTLVDDFEKGSNTSVFDDPEKRFSLLSVCSDEFNHRVPNSILHSISSYESLLEFYSTPVDETLPLDKLKRVELPPNLHIQHEYVRFHPDDDTMFGGQTAFPKSNTLVPGIRTRKKYKGHIQTEEWPSPY